jgi:hypothetical protein
MAFLSRRLQAFKRYKEDYPGSKDGIVTGMLSVISHNAKVKRHEEYVKQQQISPVSGDRVRVASIIIRQKLGTVGKQLLNTTDAVYGIVRGVHLLHTPQDGEYRVYDIELITERVSVGRPRRERKQVNYRDDSEEEEEVSSDECVAGFGNKRRRPQSSATPKKKQKQTDEIKLEKLMAVSLVRSVPRRFICMEGHIPFSERPLNPKPVDEEAAVSLLQAVSYILLRACAAEEGDEPGIFWNACDEKKDHYQNASENIDVDSGLSEIQEKEYENRAEMWEHAVEQADRFEEWACESLTLESITSPVPLLLISAWRGCEIDLKLTDF